MTITCIFLQCLNNFQGEPNQIKARRRRRSALDFVQILPLENVQNFRKGWGSVENYPDLHESWLRKCAENVRSCVPARWEKIVCVKRKKLHFKNELISDFNIRTNSKVIIVVFEK